MNKKIIYAILMFLIISTVSAYTVNERYVGNIDFKINLYECTTSACSSVVTEGVFGPNDDVTITYTGSGTESNPDNYVLFAYDPDGCYATKSGSAYWWGTGTHNFGPYSLTFSKTESDHCGTNIEITTQDNQEIEVGEKIRVNANVQAAWNLKNPPYFVPDDLKDIYSSKVDLYFTVYNEDYSQKISEKHDFVEIPHNEWYYPKYDFTPTQPGIYHLRVWSTMDNDCKCDGSNLKWDEITIIVPEPPTYCGDEIVQCLNDDNFCEECDDGNNVDGDGCDADCTIEEEGCVEGIKRDDSHIGLPGWEIHAKQVGQSDSQSISTITGQNGFFRFDGLEPARYEFWEVMQDGWEPVTLARFQAEVYEGDDCTDIAFKNRELPQFGCLEGYKRDDTGIGLPGWKIHAELQPDGNLNEYDFTDGTGYYRIDNLPVGVYDVWEIMQDGWEVAPGYEEYYDDIIIQSGDECAVVNFVNKQVEEEGCVEGIKRDDSHIGLPGWEIHAKQVGQSDSQSISTITGQNGFFRFDGLEPGTYEFWEVMQDGWEPVTLARFQAEVYEGDDCTDIAFKNRQTTGCIDGYKLQSGCNNLLNGWEIILLEDGFEVASIYTGSLGEDGYFKFDNLAPGSYVVREVMQDGWELADGYQIEYEVEVHGGEECTHVTFKNREEPLGCVAGYKRDNVNIGLPGWTINLEKVDDPSVHYSTQTDGTGLYNFIDLETGSYRIWEVMQDGWEVAPGHQEEYIIYVDSDDFCTQKTFVNKQVPTCIDECEIGEKKCIADELWTCGYFDDDVCTEWGFDEDCSFTDNRDIYYVCENEDSVSYREVTEGFCNTDLLVCDDSTHTEFVDETDCGEDECTHVEYCDEISAMSREDCLLKGCDEPTGFCYSDESHEETLIQDCTEESVDEFCDGQNIVRVETSDSCVEENNQAFCSASNSTVILDDCGPDTCIEYTVMDPEILEYVDDFEGCEENPEPYCAYEVPDHPDYCLTEDILMQSWCPDEDHTYEEFNCNDLDGCVEFTYTECVNCWNPYDGRCQGDWCDLIGLEFRDYQCGNGACQYVVSEFIDVDNDMLDDRCDDCIDVDRDGICDDEDTCPGVYNPTNVDTDNDGYGNACDDDRDGDGYLASEDCDDWNDEVHPNAEEIKNNGRDDDCNPDTDDKGAYTARQALYVNVLYDEYQIKPGNQLDIIVSVSNNDVKTLDNLRIMAAISGFQEKQRGLIQELKTGETARREFTIDLPEDFSDDFEELKISIGNDNYKRIIYRELRLE